MSRFCPLAPTATTSEPGGRDDCAIVSPLDDLTLKFTDLLIVTERAEILIVGYSSNFLRHLESLAEFREDNTLLLVAQLLVLLQIQCQGFCAFGFCLFW